MRATWNGITIAESEETVVVEGSHYFPPDAVEDEHLKRSAMRSLCPWKGVAAYHHVDAGGVEGRNVAWTYRHPFPWIRKIKDHVAFWGGVEVRP